MDISLDPERIVKLIRLALPAIKLKISELNQNIKRPDPSSKTYIGDVCGVKIFLVDGDIAKKEYDMDFVEGGHDLVKKYIPDGEIWVDYNIDVKCRCHIILHETIERILMKSGMGYDEAHDIANQYEKEEIELSS